MRWNKSSSAKQNDEDTAALWAVRRSRGLSAVEQDELSRWLAENPAHARALAREEATLGRMAGLAQWRPKDSEANPDLFAPRAGARTRRGRGHFRFLGFTSLLAAASLAVWIFGPRPEEAAPLRPAPPAQAEKSLFLRVTEKQALPDGSLMDIRDGTRFVLAFSERERRVRLLSGEIYCQVAKDAGRPFVVETSGASVTATGTAFSVQCEPRNITVLVTEGAVRMDPRPLAPASGWDAPPPAPHVQAGQLASLTVDGEHAAGEIKVRGATPAIIEDALAWREPRLQFHETTLATAVAEFNRHAGAKLVVADPALAAELVGGTFRLDRVESFLRLVTATLEVQVERKENGELILRRAR